MSSPQGSDAASADLRLRRLHKGCEITLERYQSIASDTCKLLGHLRTLPVSRDKRLEIFLQKKKEDQARAAYLKARDVFLQALDERPEEAAKMPEVVAMPPRRTPRSGAYRRRSG